MNTPERNDKNVEKLQKLRKVYEESDEDKKREEIHKSVLEEATREYPLPTARRFSIVAVVAFWFFCFLGLLFRVDLSGIFPFMFIALATMVILHLPMFFMKRKILDVIIGAAFAMGCIGLAVSLLR
jgi:hypothetical protein